MPQPNKTKPLQVLPVVEGKNKVWDGTRDKAINYIKIKTYSTRITQQTPTQPLTGNEKNEM